ncbi:MAG: TraM recognition domain-containing protein, partial [Alphaproteobacteria bacterium]|nr:TraM recognition domain-containing protein [Alphaproteobacteria bacterium]
MTLKTKYQYKHEALLRDSRPLRVRMVEGAQDPQLAATIFIVSIVMMYSAGTPLLRFPLYSDLIFFAMLLYFWWLKKRDIVLPFKLPKSAHRVDSNYIKPNGQKGLADGILFLGNDASTSEEIWFTNNDARTHCLYLGTTGSGKTFGLKSFSCNALCWSSGYIYIDGKADTDLWSTLSAMARRFGRDDDLLIMNYMTGNIGGRVPSNTLNPFSSGSASYLTNMLVSLMPDAGGDNAMWKERAISLVSAIMPCLVWKRDNQNIPMSIASVRTYLTFKAVIKLARDSTVPQTLRTSVIAYLNELPGYVDDVFDDNGDEKPQPPDAAPVDTSVPRQQHGYLSMQFTRSMSSLGDDYGFIFDTQAADIDMMDVVLNRRILVVLIPALEKSSDETSNLGKIISSTLKGMMGATLGSTIEGDTATAIENKPTTSSTPFMAIFDEVGYYTAQGMAVMAAQARSLGFSLIFSAQDLPALEKRVKEEARSITANCNIKLFGKLEDPTQTKDFFEKTVGSALVTEVSGFQRGAAAGGIGGASYMDSQNASIQVRSRASYDGLKGFTEGRAVCSFGKTLNEITIYNSDVGHAKAMRVQRFLPVPPPSEDALESLHNVNAVLNRFRDPQWRPNEPETRPNADIDAMAQGFGDGRKAEVPLVECGILA